MEYGLLKRDLGGRDQDEEVDPVKGHKVQVLGAGVCYGANVRQQLSGYRQLDGPDITPLHSVLYMHAHTHRFISDVKLKKKKQHSSTLCRICVICLT